MRNTKEFHLTLQFLGDDIQDEKPIIDALKGISLPPFEMELLDASPFGPPDSPRGVWINCSEPEQLMELAGKIREAMGRLSYESDKPFRAHVTLGRFRKPPRKPVMTLKHAPEKFQVTQFSLFQSHLGPDGPQYKKLATFPQD